MRELHIAGYAAALTFHGLRHTYAHELYLQYRNEGMGVKEAKLAVARRLGHERDEVTSIYLT